MSGVPAIQRHCERCIYRDRNNDTIVCALPRCAFKVKRNGIVQDRLTGKKYIFSKGNAHGKGLG